MGFDFYFEIFMMMFGWLIVNIIVLMLFGIGFVWLFFFFMFFLIWVEVFEKGLDEGVVIWMVCKLEVQVYMGLFVFLICFVVFLLMDFLCVSLYFMLLVIVFNFSLQIVMGVSIGIIYDIVFSGMLQVVVVLVYWYMVMLLFLGMNLVVCVGVNGGMKDLCMIQDVVNIVMIFNLVLCDEIQGFYNECFIFVCSCYL